MNFNFETDEDTVLLFEMVVWCLVKYFGHTEETSVGLVNDFCNKAKSRWEDDFYHHETPFRVAARIHYVSFMKGNNSEFADWVLTSKWGKPPQEAIDYYKRVFWGE